MDRKITWQDIYKDFRRQFPHLRGEAIHYHPYDYMAIMIYFKNGDRMVYDGLRRLGRPMFNSDQSKGE